MSVKFPDPIDRIVILGTHTTIEYAVRADGTMEAKSWLKSQNDVVKRSFATLFFQLANHGRIHNTSHFRQIEDEIWEFKKTIHRILCFRCGRRWLLTHRFKKAGGIGKCPVREITHARNISQEHLQFELNAESKGGRK